MPAIVIKPTQLVGTTALVTIGGQVPVGKKRRCDLRACNVTNPGAFATADVYINDTVTPANSGYRCRNFPVPYLEAGSAPDLEYGLILVAGQQLQIRGSADAAIGFSLTAVEDDA